MPKTKKTDLQVLRAVLGLAVGKLSSTEKTVFQRMYDDVAGGLVISLSKKQRAWVDGVYDKHDLDNPQREAAQAVKILDTGLLPKTKPKVTSADALRKRAAQLGIPEPIPEDRLAELIPAISPEAMKAIEKNAKERQWPTERLAVAYLRKILG